MDGPNDAPDPSTNCSFSIDEEDAPWWDCDFYFPEEGEESGNDD